MDIKIEIELKDSTWGFSDLLGGRELNIQTKKEIIELLKEDIREVFDQQIEVKQLILSGVGSSFLNELIEKHKANKKLALDNCKKMKDSNQYPWYDATFNNELLFVFDLEDLKIRSGL